MRIRWMSVGLVGALVLASLANPAEQVVADGSSSADCGPRSIDDEFLALSGVVGSTSAEMESVARELADAPGVLDATILDDRVQLTFARDAMPTAPMGIPARFSCLTQAEIEWVKTAVSDLEIAPGNFVTVGYSPHTDRVVVTTNSDEVSATELSSRSGVSENLIIVAVVPTEGGRLSRTSDAAAHKGGARIVSGSTVAPPASR